MGLGKTLQTIAVLLYAKERKIEEGKFEEKVLLAKCVSVSQKY
jgi:SNF2 family DNA or RNA helicase